jgi:hypothetical protein
MSLIIQTESKMEEKIYKINAEKLTSIKRFISEAFTLPPERMNLEITYTPHIYLVPFYNYTSSIDWFVRTVFGPKLTFERMNIIDFYCLSLFRPIKPSKRLIKFNFYLQLSEGKVRIRSIRAEEIYRSFDYEFSCDSTGRFFSQEWINAIRRALGDNYSDYDRRRSSYVYYSMQHVEKEMFLVATFLYSLYTGEYETENLPFEWANFLRKYGNNFDEVIKNINLAILLTGF